ncbi:MAG: hypothetical protein WD607_00315 [Candidatus Paceibacterota bacterium]
MTKQSKDSQPTNLKDWDKIWAEQMKEMEEEDSEGYGDSHYYQALKRRLAGEDPPGMFGQAEGEMYQAQISLQPTKEESSDKED